MEKTKPLGKGSFLKTVLRALGIGKDFVFPWLSHAEAKRGDSVSYAHHEFTRTALLEAEEAKAKAIMELQKKPLI